MEESPVRVALWIEGGVLQASEDEANREWCDLKRIYSMSPDHVTEKWQTVTG